MLAANETILTNLNAPVRTIKAKAELYNGSALAFTYTEADRIKSIKVYRDGEASKFFGFGICQKLNLKLIDKARQLDLTTANSFRILLDNVAPFPLFHITEVNRDEKTNELSITAYDALYGAAAHYTAEVEIEAPYTLAQYATACGALLGLEVVLPVLDMFSYIYGEGANLEGSETIREALNAIAEATQTIYFINGENKLEFKQLSRDGLPVFTIDKSKIINLSSKTNKRLGTICYATELGDNVSASTTEAGSTQYVRDNPFLTLEDVAPLLENAIAAVGGLTINQFTCSWRGNYLLELGDKIALITKDNKQVYAFLLIDTLTYDGSLSQSSEWSFEDNEAESADNPVSLGDALKQTYARVDKANKQIDLLVSEVGANDETIASLQLNNASITASVQALEQQTNETLNTIETISTQVSSKMSAEDVQIEVKKQIDNGVSKVVTTTVTIDDIGLSVAKSGSEMETSITEDGMQVFKGGSAVLTANNVGVEARNLHATTYLIIGTNSRIEDYGSGRTGCFWIGE